MGWVVNDTPRPLYPQERHGTNSTEGWVGPRAGLDEREKSRPHRDSIPGPSSPVASCYTDWVWLKENFKFGCVVISMRLGHQPAYVWVYWVPQLEFSDVRFKLYTYTSALRCAQSIDSAVQGATTLQTHYTGRHFAWVQEHGDRQLFCSVLALSMYAVTINF